MRPASPPILAITMGDPAGCGPEVIARAFQVNATDHGVRTIVVGNTEIMRSAVTIAGGDCQVKKISRVNDADFQAGTINVFDLESADLRGLAPGKVQAIAGEAAYTYVTQAIDLALAGEVAGVVTAPLSKEAMNLAGHHFDGHTEIFARRTHTKTVAMMLASEAFRVTHVSTHCSLREAIERCKTERVLDVIHLTDQALRQMGVENPSIAVAGLNPHCGEGGLFGREDVEQIQPAIDQALAKGLRVFPQPVPPDTVFVRMAQFKEFDAVVAQYHDQGHIASKLVDFWGGVNITIGLPIIRTSVDHGTAFDIVGTGKANPTSLIRAIEYACLMAEHRAFTISTQPGADR